MLTTLHSGEFQSYAEKFRFYSFKYLSKKWKFDHKSTKLEEKYHHSKTKLSKDFQLINQLI